MRAYYIINTETTAVLPHYEQGYEYSRVLEGKDTFLVSQSPDQIVEDSFNVIGNDLANSRQDARSILNGGKYMVPVALSAELGIILIRCNSIRQKGTIWLISSQIKNIQPAYNGRSIIKTLSGHSITITMKANSLQEKRNQASILEKILLQRHQKNQTRTFLFDKNSGISVVKDLGHFTYSEEKSEEEESG